jgi:hypothetical protein
MAETAHAFEVSVRDDGELVVPADDLARHGVHPGDVVRIEPVRKAKRVSRLGSHRRPLGFDEDHLREIRHEMGEHLGEGFER